MKKEIIKVSNKEFEEEWESTGHMIQSKNKLSYSQTYGHQKYEDRYKQIGGSIGEVHLEKTEE